MIEGNPGVILFRVHQVQQALLMVDIVGACPYLAGSNTKAVDCLALPAMLGP
jgi:hypothetical protein